jgi:LPS export ABC transporter protein LptC
MAPTNRLLLLLFLVGPTLACSDTQQQLNEREVYEGAFREFEGLELWYSDSAVVRLMVQAEKVLEYESGDQEYPEGIYVEFFNKDSVRTSTLKADQAFYSMETDEYRAVGNVMLESLEKHQKLNTEELFWNRRDQQVYTEKFVVIETEDDVLHGEGLTAAQDFSSYRILKPTGELGFD